MPSPNRGTKQDETRAWWADVQHLREAAERRALDTPRGRPRPEPLTVETIQQSGDPDIDRAIDVDARGGADIDRAIDVDARGGERRLGRDASRTTAEQPIPRRRSGPSAQRDELPAGRIALADLDPELIDLDFATPDVAAAHDDLLPGSELDLVSGVIDPEAPRRRQARHVHRPVGQRPARSKTPRAAPPIWLADEPEAAQAARRPASADPAQGAGASAEPARRRTVEIRGRTVGAPSVPRLVDADGPAVAPRPSHRRRRQGDGIAARLTAQPDRVALWAVLMGFFLIVVAAMSAHG